MKEAVITVSTNNLQEAIKLEDLYELAIEAIELGLPPKNTYLVVNGKHVYGRVQVVFATGKVNPILCGDHMAGEDVKDILIDTHSHNKYNSINDERNLL